MQQRMPQQDQMSAQQAQQQMVLCPVRVVYETQILVQPGEQIQPNQTLFINPQNPPPWAQSRPVQNPVIYVQQMPSNIVPSLPQHMDQNQLYLHQYPYQQMIPQMVQNVQENRQNAMQMPNLIQQNVIQNFQPNLASNMAQNISALPDRTMQQPNYGQIHQNIAQNVQLQPQQQVNIANNSIVNRPADIVTSMQNQVQQSQYNGQKVEMKSMYMSGGQVQSINMARNPQVLTVNPMQNIQQTFAPTIRSIKTESVGSQITPPTYVNASQNTHISRIRKLSPNNSMNKINPNVTMRSVGQTQTYRPIQPRPQQFRPNIPNFVTGDSQAQSNSMPILNQNLVNINSNIPIPNISQNAMTVIRNEDQNTNRKRKSESPDEIHKKMAAIQVNIAAPMKQISDIKRSADMGTSPIHRNEMTIIPSILQSNNVKINITTSTGVNEMKLTEVKNVNIMQNVQQNACMPSLDPIEPQKINTQHKEIQNSPVDKDKLIRNTVFTQARGGRVLTDKESLLKDSTIPESIQVLKEITVTPKDTPIEQNNRKLEANKPFQDLVKKEENIKPPVDINIIKEESKPPVVKEETDVKVTKDITVVKHEKKEEESTQMKEIDDMKVSLNTTNNKGMFPVERGVKQERDYILTHVLDGIVIQESNVAFPIREPLIKRITQSTANIINEIKDLKEDKNIEEIPKVKETDVSLMKENIDKGVAQGDNPFSNMAASTLKSWTTEQLSSHLSLHGWANEAALFAEHEIDGESLHLVSKPQLLAIGVDETHADALCCFIKS